MDKDSLPSTQGDSQVWWLARLAAPTSGTNNPCFDQPARFGFYLFAPWLYRVRNQPDHLKKVGVDGRRGRQGGRRLAWRSLSGTFAGSPHIVGPGEAPKAIHVECSEPRTRNVLSQEVVKWKTWAGANTAMDIGPDQVLASSTSWSNLELGWGFIFEYLDI